MKIIQASLLIDGTGGEPRKDYGVLIEGQTLRAVVPPREIGDLEQLGTEVIRFPGCTLLPGYVNCHSHLTMSGDGTPVEDTISLSDERLLLRAVRNAHASLVSGVTTLADLGARNSITLALRDAIAEAEIPGPDLVVCGRPLTITGGHCWMFGGQADTDEEIVKACRDILASGADLLKVMGTGGGTKGSNPYMPQYGTEQFRLMVQEARRRGKPTFVHCSTSEAIQMCLDAGVDMVVHGHFNTPDRRICFVPEIAERAAERGTFWNPTLFVNRAVVQRLEQSAHTAEQKRQLDARRRAYDAQCENFRRLVEYGVNLVAGSDEGWGNNPFGGFTHEICAMIDAGMSTAKAIASATSLSAKALGIDGFTGSLVPGKLANLIVLGGNPFECSSAFHDVRRVMKRGAFVR